MNAAHSYLRDTEGLSFYKLMGTGRDGGFDPRPDWGTYAVLTVWDDQSKAETYATDHPLIQAYQRRGEVYSILMRHRTSHGYWDKKNPFEQSQDIDDMNPWFAVITRARIKMSHLRRFWSYVPTSQRPLQGAEGLIYTKGIGEVPILNMATFSIWTDKEALRAYAYQSTEHQKAIQMTKEYDWYAEELFARFQPYKTVGTYNRQRMLPF